MTRDAENGALTPGQQRLVKETLHLVEAIARSVVRHCPRAEYDELYAAGCEALVGRARAYDPARDAAFSTFAWLRVLFAVREAAKAPPFSPAAQAALDVMEELEDGTNVFASDDEDFERYVLESANELSAGYTLAFVGDWIQRLGEDGLVLLEERARILETLRAVVAALPPRRPAALPPAPARPTPDAGGGRSVRREQIDDRQALPRAARAPAPPARGARDPRLAGAVARAGRRRARLPSEGAHVMIAHALEQSARRLAQRA